jgi:hypothetical protein
MKRWFAFWGTVALAVALAGVLSRTPRALAKVEAFRVTGIRVEGARYLTQEEALKTLALPAQASVWDDTRNWEMRLRHHPLVSRVTVHRRFPGTLVLQVEEREPVALYPAPALEPVDRSGRVLPIDPGEHPLDLPIMALAGARGLEALTPAQRRLMAEEIHRITQGDPELLARVSDITLDARGDLHARLSGMPPESGSDLNARALDSPVILHFRPGVPHRRIQAALQVLEDASTRFEGRRVTDLDLRYEDQVVARLARAGGR